MKKLLIIGLLVAAMSCSNSSKDEKNISNSGKTGVKQEDVKKPENKSNQNKELKELVYSNLVDKETQNEAAMALKDAGVNQESIDLFLKSVNFFNDSVKNQELVKQGFKISQNINPDYNEEILQKLWDEKNPKFPGFNCRITSFTIMRQFLKTSTFSLKDETKSLFLDEEALNNVPFPLFNDTEKKTFKTIFSAIATENTKDINVHLKKVKDEWNRLGVKFSNNDKISMISMFFHSQISPEEENTLFIGHTGILLKLRDGKLLFLEKLAFQEPYQAIKFENRAQLKKYLTNKYDTEWGQPTARPFIMENAELMKD